MLQEVVSLLYSRTIRSWSFKDEVGSQHWYILQLVCVWLFEAWKVIRNHFDIIKKTWEKCGLFKAFEKSFQASAMEENAKCSFFVEKASDTTGSEELIEDEDYDDLEDLFDAKVMDMMAKCHDSI